MARDERASPERALFASLTPTSARPQRQVGARVAETRAFVRLYAPTSARPQK